MVNNELLNNEQKAKSIKWDDLIIRCEWKKEVMDYVNQYSITNKDDIDHVSIEKPCSFDYETLKEMIEEDGVAVIDR